MFKKIQKWILPKEINFFKNLIEHGEFTLKLVEELKEMYMHHTPPKSQKLEDLIDEGKKQHLDYLKELNSTFITPVDKEALSRVHIHLNWVALSIKHLLIETKVYKIEHLKSYASLFDGLKKELAHLNLGFQALDIKNFKEVQHQVNLVVKADNELIKAYAHLLDELFKEKDHQKIFRHKEILSQLKEISKRIHICANHVEDIIFKMD